MCPRPSSRRARSRATRAPCEAVAPRGSGVRSSSSRFPRRLASSGRAPLRRSPARNPGRPCRPPGSGCGRRPRRRAASWVTITIVWPNSSTARRSRASTSSLAWESRLPVGSSAKTTAGCESSARAIATRCCCPPESSAGRWPRRSPSPTASTRRLSSSGSALRPARSSGSTMFSWLSVPATG